VSAEPAIRRVDGSDVLGRLRRDVLDVHSRAHRRSSRSPRQREFVNRTLPRHTARDAFAFWGAFDESERLRGFAYGYTGAAGQWWHDVVSAALDEPARRLWLGAPCFELCELAVHPRLQGRGLGGVLHDALLAERTEGRALLTARADDERVHRFYSSRGWSIVLPKLSFGPGYPPYSLFGRRLPPGR
jgi:GNAT superfamily N-acetyltransferase